MKQSLNYTVFFSILFTLIISSIIGYYLLNNSQKKNHFSKQQEINDLQIEILNLEYHQIKSDFELLEEYNLNTVLVKLQLAKEYEEKIQKIFSDSLSSNDFYEKYKPYNECVNLLYEDSKYETITLKKQISIIKNNILKLQQGYIEKDIESCKKDIEKISHLISEKKIHIQTICENFDSLYHNINSYIK